MEHEIIRAGAIEAYLACPYSYYLSTLVKDSAIPLSGFAAMKAWLKNAFLKLLPDENYVGPDLVHIERVVPADLPKYLKYKSPDSFASAMKEGWRRHIIENRGMVHDRPVVWAYRNQWWKAYNEIGTACKNHYEILLREGVPVSGLSGREVGFEFRGRKFNVRFDAVWRGMALGEEGVKKIDQRELDSNWMVTMRMLAFCALARKVEPYRMKLGVEEFVTDSWAEDIGIAPDVKYRYYNLSDGSVIETGRDCKSVDEMLRIVEEAQWRIDDNDFSPNLKACHACRYNVPGADGEPVCKKRNPKARPLRPMSAFEDESESN